MSHKLKYEDVKNIIESEYGYKLLSEEYKNSDTKLDVECPIGHKYSVLIYNFKYGNRCPYCAKKKKYTYNEVKNYIESFGYKLLSEEYKNSQTDLLIKCPVGHIYKAKFNTFKNGIRCAKCSKVARYSYKEVKEYIESYGYQLLSEEYKNAHTKLKLKCPKGHEYETKFNTFKNRIRCPICWYNSRSSKPEREIQQFVSTIYNGEIKPNDKDTIINPLTGHNLEIDIFMKELRFGIEYNGKYWHEGEYRKRCDKIKKEECTKMNIDLLVIEELDWNNNKDYCLKKIKRKIENKNEYR